MKSKGQMSTDEYYRYVEWREEQKTLMAKTLWRQGLPLGHIVFTLTAEDVLDCLVDLQEQGKFDLDNISFSDFPTLVLNVADDIEYSLDWRPHIKMSIFETLHYLKGVKEDELRNEQQKREGSSLSTEEGSGS